jgi:asparagine synthase (glutamine-hydrolysing)
MWQGVRELRPGSILALPGDQIQYYWQLRENLATNNTLNEPSKQQCLAGYGHQLRVELEQVVQDYLPTSEVGVFLSGGLDSSAITALASHFHHKKVHTYSIHFGDRFPDELAFSGLVANHCQTHHHILEIPLRQMWKELPETMALLDDPIGDPLTVPNLLLARLARESVDIILNGEGGDPCFGGPKNQPMLMNQLYGTVMGQGSLQAFLLAFQKCAADLHQLLQPEVWQVVKDKPSIFSEALLANASYLNRLMMLNIQYKGADHILTKVSNLTQAAGIEGRSPLFDQRIVELSMKIPPEYKLSGVQEKVVLKQAIADLLPAEIVQRPKSGMMVPVQWGFKNEWQRGAKKLLLSRKAAIAPYLNQDLIREWLSYRGDTWQRYGVKLWLLVSLELWLQGNGK